LCKWPKSVDILKPRRGETDGHDSTVISKAVYLASGVNMGSIKEVLGMWSAENEGAKFLFQVVTELKNGG
jgi:putative transposase